MRKVMLRAVLMIFILVILIKIYHFIIMNQFHNAVENFKNEENRYYSVVCKKDSNLIKETRMFAKEDIIKYIEIKNEVEVYCEWRDLKENEEYSIHFDSKKALREDLLNEKRNLLINMPDLIWNMYQNNKLNVKELFKLQYIIPITYNNKKCYKIKTKTEAIIIEQSTYLPIYSNRVTINSEGESQNKIEYMYEFKVNSVTDEEIALPDLSSYELISK